MRSLYYSGSPGVGSKTNRAQACTNRDTTKYLLNGKKGRENGCFSFNWHQQRRAQALLQSLSFRSFREKKLQHGMENAGRGTHCRVMGGISKNDKVNPFPQYRQRVISQYTKHYQATFSPAFPSSICSLNIARPF